MKKWLARRQPPNTQRTGHHCDRNRNAANIDNHDETSTSPELGNGNESHS
jgi:hypothetical protein